MTKETTGERGGRFEKQTDFPEVIVEASKQRGLLFLPPTNPATVYTELVQGKISLNSPENGIDRDEAIDIHLISSVLRVLSFMISRTNRW